MSLLYSLNFLFLMSTIAGFMYLNHLYLVSYSVLLSNNFILAFGIKTVDHTCCRALIPT